MTQKTIKGWYLVHKWTSLVCTVFLLMLCITGLPLIFHEEIDDLIGAHPVAINLPADTPLTSLDNIVKSALAARPGFVPQFMSFDDHGEPIVYMGMGLTPTSQGTDAHFDAFDARTAEPLAMHPFNEGVMYFIFKLHVDMFAGLPGELFLGFMGLLFVIAIVSGVVIYGPFMRKLDFGTVRKTKSTRIKWLDLHNMLGVIILAWTIVVGFTGVINTLAIPILQLWQYDQLAEMVAPYKDKPALSSFSSIQVAHDVALKAAPEMKISFIAFPETAFSSKHHYAVFMEGATPLTSKLLKPALIDAETGSLTDMRSMPWYTTALFISQPLHFGDYGGMPMKILWAVLDIATIFVLGSGLYLWLGRRRSSLPARLAELQSGAAEPVSA
ncbi:MAG: PepSY domain-containing protein [Pseudomonadota bacterium]